MNTLELCEEVSAATREELVAFLRNLRDQICDGFQRFEREKKFERTSWPYSGGGGGEMSVLRGDVFEKAAVNWSQVEGESYPTGDGSGPFYATGVSLITHMMNPHAPTVHMNIRFIQTGDRFWFGGGYDLTPMGFPNEEDTQHFHQTAEATLHPFGPDLYSTFSQQAAEYFYIPHRKKERGVGGIFFDHYNTGHWEQDLNLWKAVGTSFIEAILPILHRRIHTPYGPAEKSLQNQQRAHYVEFNLLYDRGTKFGFQSGGNHEAILCSMPPTASW